MENCFMIRSSPATAMLIRFRWLMKQSAMSKATIRQRTGVGWLRAGSAGRVMGERSSKSQAPSSKEAPRPKNLSEPPDAAIEDWCLEVLWDLELVTWSFSSPRLRYPILLDERVVQRDAEARTIGHCDPAVLGLKLFLRQFVAHR